MANGTSYRPSVAEGGGPSLQAINMKERTMSTSSISGVSPVSPTPSTQPVSDTDSKSQFDKVFQQVAGNILNSGQSMVQEAMGKMFEEEEPDEDDPDAESL